MPLHEEDGWEGDFSKSQSEVISTAFRDEKKLSTSGT